MTAFPSYSTGSVSVSAAGTVVTGVSTIWSGVNARPGDLLQIGAFAVFISDVTDVTHLAIPPWGGSNVTAGAYTIYQTSPLRFAGGQAMADVSALVAALNALGFIVFVSPGGAPDPSLGEDGQYATDQSTGTWWKKIAGVWTLTSAPVAGYGGTSATSLVIANTVTRVFTTQANLAYNGARVRAASAAAPSNYMEGICAYSGTTLTMTVDAIGGSGTKTDWVFSVVGTPGANGTSGIGYGGTSTTSLVIANTVTRVFTTQANLAYNGARVRAASAAAPSNYMEGICTYSGTTLTMTVDAIGGSGTETDWVFSVVGTPGANGTSGIGYGGTSTTSLVIANTVTRVFTTQANLAYNGARVRAASAAAPSNYMEGICTYSGTTLTMTVDAIGGSGTKTDWVFSVVGTPGISTAASKSDQQTATSNAVAVTPLHQQDHDSAAKAWVMFTGSATNGAQTINASYGIASVSRTALGQYTVVFTTLFASAAYVIMGINNGSTIDGCVEVNSQSAGSANIVFPKLFTTTASLFDPVNGAYLVFFGRQ